METSQAASTMFDPMTLSAEADEDRATFRRISMSKVAAITRYCDQHGSKITNEYGTVVWAWTSGSDEGLKAEIDPEGNFSPSAVRYARQEVTGALTDHEWRRSAAGREAVAKAAPKKTLEERLLALEAEVGRVKAAADDIRSLGAVMEAARAEIDKMRAMVTTAMDKAKAEGLIE